MYPCVDLKNCFGDRYRVNYEESYEAERGLGSRLHDPWLMTIPSRHGHIYAHGGDYLAASTNHRGPIANRLAALPCVQVVQDGDDGLNAVFDVCDFDQVAAVMKPKLRRQLTPDQRAERVERLREYQFRPATHGAGEDRRRDPTPTSGSQGVSTRRGVI